MVKIICHIVNIETAVSLRRVLISVNNEYIIDGRIGSIPCSWQCKMMKVIEKDLTGKGSKGSAKWWKWLGSDWSKTGSLPISLDIASQEMMQLELWFSESWIVIRSIKTKLYNGIVKGLILGWWVHLPPRNGPHQDKTWVDKITKANLDGFNASDNLKIRKLDQFQIKSKQLAHQSHQNYPDLRHINCTFHHTTATSAG